MAVAGPVATAQQPRDTGAEAATFDTAPWHEQEARLPAYPKEERLIRFDTGPTSTLRFFVDRDSLAVGADGVVRFTLVAKSDGAANVSYEGIRCSMREVTCGNSAPANSRAYASLAALPSELP